MKTRSFLVIALGTCVTFCNQKDTGPTDVWPRDVQPRLSNASAWRFCTPKGAVAGRVVEQVQCETSSPAMDDTEACAPEINNTRQALRILSFQPHCIDTAIRGLERFSRTDARALSDLAAAYYVRAQRKDQPSDLLHALHTADLALVADPTLPAALFNHALASEALGLSEIAIGSWDRLIDIERSPWADEARRHRDDLIRKRVSDDATLWRRNREALPMALAARDRKAVARLIAPFPSAAQRYFEEELLPRWAETPTRERLDQATLFASELSARLAGDRFPTDVVQAIVRAASSPEKLRALREGHRAFLAGRLAEKTFDNHSAETAYQTAANRLEYGGSPFRLRASLGFIVTSSFAANARSHARQSLLPLEKEAAGRNYRHLRARILWGQANFMDQSDYLGSLDQYNAALFEYARLHDAEGMTAIHSRMGGVLRAAGDGDRAWRELFYATRHASHLIELRDRHARLNEVVESMLAFGYPRTALQYENSAVRMIQNELTSTKPEDIARIKDVEQNHLAIARGKRALIELRLGHIALALKDLDESARVAETKIDPDTRRILNARIEEVKGQSLLRTDARGAIAAFTDALKLTSADFHTMRASLLVQRAAAKRLAGHAAEADGDLRDALADLHAEEKTILANRRLGKGETLWRSYFSRFQETYHLLISHLIDTQPFQAFIYAERARAIEPLDLVLRRQSVPDELRILAEDPPRDEATARAMVARIQRHIPAGSFVVQYCVLDDRTYTWVLSRDTFKALPAQRATRQQIERWSARLQQAVTDQNVTGVDIVLRAAFEDLAAAPLGWIDSQPASDQEKRVVFIPDGAIHGLPLGALREAKTGKYVFERFPVEISGSTALYLWSLERNDALNFTRGPSLLAIGDPAFDPELTHAYGLTELRYAEEEALLIGAMYARAVILPPGEATVPAFLERAPHYDIIHFAGHAVVIAGTPPRSFLVLARSSGRSGTVDAEELLTRLKLDRTRLVVLATCSSAGGLPVGPEGVAPLVRSLLGAGAPAVVGSLWAVNDATTKELMVSFHRHYEESGDAALALQAAQRESLTNKNNIPGLRSVLAWAPFQVIGHASPPARAPSNGGTPLGLHSSNSLQRPDRLRPQ